jgi:hypothetical protein
VGVECTTCADGMALHVTLSVRCAVALPPSGCFFDQGVTTFWRRGVAYGSPMETVPAEFSTRACRHPPVALDAVRASLNASRSFPGSPAAPWWEGLAALDAHAGGRRSGLAVTAVLVEPAVGEFPDLSAPGLLEFGRCSQPSSGTRSSGFAAVVLPIVDDGRA